ncbi:MAG: hypothetical protein ABJA90_07435 [Ginsengibacter sp.]
MNKSFLFRILAITVFCFASLAIKSETSTTCNIKCSSGGNSSLILQSSILSEQQSVPAYPYESFYIKI